MARTPVRSAAVAESAERISTTAEVSAHEPGRRRAAPTVPPDG